MTKNFCFKCGGEMGMGVALVNSWWVHADFEGDYTGELKDVKDEDIRGQTMSMTGPAKLIRVKKCKDCGRSVTPLALDEGKEDKVMESNSRTTQKQDQLIDLLRNTWRKYPHMRLGQLISNVVWMHPSCEDGDTFSIPDEDFSARLKIYMKGSFK